MPPQSSDPSVTQQVKLDAASMRFEQALRGGSQPAIESFLAELPPEERAMLLPQLLLVEWEYFEASEGAPAIDTYLQRFPTEQAIVRRAFDEHGRAVQSAFAQLDDTTGQPTLVARTGTQIGRYKLLEQIGEGGMGVVYMAQQERPVQRKVALKIIKPGMDTKQVIARFEAERQALAIMDHPNIARVLDAGSTDGRRVADRSADEHTTHSRRSLRNRSADEPATIDGAISDYGRPYFVMELVRGIPITEYCDQNRLPTDERLELFVSVCHAVQHAHQKGIIHRDIKPTNVLVTLHDGVPVPKIIDFGVAKATHQRLTEKTLFTAFAQMVGTPLYMSPEQAEMSGLDIDTRSDIYSLGVLLYELLTGATPFDRKRISTAAFDEIRRIIREEVPDKPSTRISSLGESSQLVCDQRNTDAHHLRQLLSGELDWIVMKSLEKDRTRRYQTARGMAADVSRYLAGETVEACPPTLSYRLSKFVRRYKTQAAVASLFFLLMLTSSVVGWVLFASASKAKEVAVAKTSEAVEARQRAEDAKGEIQAQKDAAYRNLERARTEERKAASLADELQRRLYDYHLTKAASAYRQDEPHKTTSLLTLCLPEQRGWEWHRLDRLTGAERKVKLAGPPIRGGDLSPVAPRMVAIDDENLRMIDLTDGRTVWTQPTEVRGNPIVWYSPGGGLIGVQSYPFVLPGRVEIWDISGQLLWADGSESEAIGMVAFSSDDQYLALSRFDPKTGTTVVALHESPSPVPLWKQPCEGLAVMAFDNEGEYLFVSLSHSGVGTASTLCCWNVNDATEVWSLPLSSTSVPCLSADNFLITGGLEHTLEVRDPATGKLIQSLSSSVSDSAYFVRSSPDGKHVVSAGLSGNIVLWDWDERVEKQSYTVNVTESALLSFTQDGDFLLVGQDDDLNLNLRSIDPPPEAQLVLAGHEGKPRAVAFSPDGEQLFSTGYDGMLRTWNAESGQELRIVTSDTQVNDLAVSNLGRYLATGGTGGAKMWSVKSGELLHHWPATEDSWWVAFSPDGTQLISCGGTEDHKRFLSLFDVSSGQELLRRDVPESLNGLTFCADGHRAVTVGFESAQLDLWDLKTGESQTIRPGDNSAHYARCLRRSPRGHLVAFGVGNTIEFWDVDRRQLVTTLKTGNDAPYCLEFNHDGSRLFSGDGRGMLSVWNLDTGEQLLSFQAHDIDEQAAEATLLNGIQSIVLSPDGRTLATCGADGLVKLWETTFPSSELTQQREIVGEATRAVNQQFELTSSRRAVFESLTTDTTLDPAALKVALDIANLRADLIDAERQSLIEAIEEAAGTDFSNIDSVPAVPPHKWYWNAYHLADANNSPLRIEQQIRLLKLDDRYDTAHQFAFLRGLCNARLGHWQEADVDFDKALSLAPQRSEFWQIYAHCQAILLAFTDQWDRYDQLCKKTVADFDDSDSSRVNERTALMCLFSNHVGGVLEQATRLADRAYEGGSKYPPNIPKLALTKAIAQLRRDELESALRMLEEASDGYAKVEMKPPPMLFLYEAITHARLDQQDKAKQSLQIGVDAAEAEWPSDRTSFDRFSDWMITQIVRREAESMVGRDMKKE